MNYIVLSATPTGDASFREYAELERQCGSARSCNVFNVDRSHTVRVAREQTDQLKPGGLAEGVKHRGEDFVVEHVKCMKAE